jgi:DNA-binding GntR family transcriptional regulator
MDSKGNLNRQTTTSAVATQLRDEITRGELQPGTWLRQGQVAERLGVSTTPVREAFALLQVEGLVRIDPHKGAIVAHVTEEDLRETYAIREVLEAMAITKAIPRLTPALLDQLEALVEEMARQSGGDEWVELNNRFHGLLVGASGLSRLNSIIASLRDASSPYIHAFAENGSTERAEIEHREILEACRARDSRRAVRAVKMHLRHSADAAAGELHRSTSTVTSRA